MRRGNRLTRQSTGLSLLGIAATVAALMPWAQSLAEDASGKLPLSAPVKVLQALDAPTRPPMETAAIQRQQRPQPTLPSGKLPQYQFGDESSQIASSDELQNAKLRFVVALPSRPILVEAVITIDGRPYRMPRESRIQEIINMATAVEFEAGVESAAEPAETAAQANDADDVEKSDASKPSTPRYLLASTAAEFVRRYFAATGREPSAEEVRWLLAERIDGPVLLMLRDNFQRFRANQRPVFRVLDRDRDGAVSPEELQRAVASFQECDFNRDGIIGYTEIAQAADDPRFENVVKGAVEKLIDLSGDAAATPDVTLAVSFNTSDPGQSTLAITAANGELQGAAAAARVNGQTITLSLEDAVLTFSAVQNGGSDQISLGAVNDGYPLLPVIDPNDDGRFTVRELRELVDRLQSFDRNQDGRLTADETPPTIRVCFGLGPLVHRELTDIRSVNPPSAAPAVQSPEWFTRMDRNKDNDLTRAEFPGTDEQFQTLDADEDGLVSGQEAAQFESRSQSPP